VGGPQNLSGCCGIETDSCLCQELNHCHRAHSPSLCWLSYPSSGEQTSLVYTILLLLQTLVNKLPASWCRLGMFAWSRMCIVCFTFWELVATLSFTRLKRW
jgi:hypothetical protein